MSARVSGTARPGRNVARRVLLAGAALIAYVAVSLGGAALLSALAGQLFAAWGVTAQNLADAPGWAQAAYRGYAEGSALLRALAAIGAALALRRAMTGTWRGPRGSGALVWGCAGLMVGVIATAALRVMDAIRWGWPLNAPRGTPEVMLAMLAVVAAAVADELFFRDLMLTALSGLNGWAAIAVSAAAFSVTAFAVIPGAVMPVALINGALLGAIAAMLYQRMGGIRAAASFRAVLNIVLFPVMGMAGAGASLYESYPVQWPPMSGGAAGPMNALTLTALLLAIGALLFGVMKGERIRP